MTNTNDPFLAQPGDAGMQPAQPSPQMPVTPPPDITFEPGPPVDPAWEQPPSGGTMPPSPPQPAAPQAPAGPVYGAAPTSPQPPTYAQYPQGYPAGPRPTKTWMNIVALVTGIMGISLAAVIFGHLGMRAASRGEAEYRGLGLAGVILGYLGLALFLIWAIAAVFLFATGAVTTTSGF